jgi:hypothetical protein
MATDCALRTRPPVRRTQRATYVGGQSALFKEHRRAVAVELQERMFAETNSVAAQISGRTPMTIEDFVAKNRAGFLPSRGYQ